MPLMQYTGLESTMVRLTPGEEKVKVREGEIVEVADETIVKSLLSNAFQEVSDESKSSEGSSGSKVPKNFQKKAK